MKNLLVIGQEDVEHKIVDILKSSNVYMIFSYSGRGDTSFSYSTIMRYFESNGKTFDAVLIDHFDKDTAKAVIDSGYKKPIIGCVPSAELIVPHATVNVVLDAKDPQGRYVLRTTLDGMLWKA